jgi:hypothetical protein
MASEEKGRERFLCSFCARRSSSLRSEGEGAGEGDGDGDGEGDGEGDGDGDGELFCRKQQTKKGF